MKKEFVRKLEAYVTKVDYDDFDKLIQSTEMGGLDEEGFFDPLINFAGPMS